jgi:hypothetical protein
LHCLHSAAAGRLLRFRRMFQEAALCNFAAFKEKSSGSSSKALVSLNSLAYLSVLN